MAEQSDEGTKTSHSSNSTGSSEVVLPPKPPEEGSSQSSPSYFNKDLKSVLVTSVLNLETLDVDLYRYSCYPAKLSFCLIVTELTLSWLIVDINLVGFERSHSLACLRICSPVRKWEIRSNISVMCVSVVVSFPQRDPPLGAPHSTIVWGPDSWSGPCCCC